MKRPHTSRWQLFVANPPGIPGVAVPVFPFFPRFPLILAAALGFFILLFSGGIRASLFAFNSPRPGLAVIDGRLCRLGNGLISSTVLFGPGRRLATPTTLFVIANATLVLRRRLAFTLASVRRRLLPFLFASGCWRYRSRLAVVIPLRGLWPFISPALVSTAVIPTPVIPTPVATLLRHDNPVFKPVVQSIRDRTRTAIIVHIVGNVVDIDDARNVVAITHLALATKARRQRANPRRILEMAVQMARDRAHAAIIVYIPRVTVDIDDPDIVVALIGVGITVNAVVMRIPPIIMLARLGRGGTSASQRGQSGNNHQGAKSHTVLLSTDVPRWNSLLG